MNTLTAEELAKEIARVHDDVRSAGDIPRFADLAKALLPFIQSHAAGVHGVADGPLSSRLRPDVECAPWVIEEVKKLERRLATPQPPKDAGAVPIPEEFAHVCNDGYWLLRVAGTARFDIPDTRFGGQAQSVYSRDQLITYGDDREAQAYLNASTRIKNDTATIEALNAREAAGRADAVPAFIREHAAQKIADSILRSPTDNIDEDNGSVALLDVLANAFGDKTVGPAMDWMIDAVFEALKDFPMHPPAEPAARAQVGDGACGYVNKDGTVTWYAENFGTVSCKPKPGAQIFTHPSPAHAGAGDAEALADEHHLPFATHWHPGASTNPNPSEPTP